jgi:hypothetical protein
LPPTVHRAQPSLTFVPQRFNRPVTGFVQKLLPLWLRSQTSISKVEARNAERLVDLYQQFQAGKLRFFLAFRHPSTDDPLCMSYLLGQVVPRAARQQGVRLRSPVHSYFLYDRGIPLWAGAGVGWLFPRMGGSSIVRGKLDRQGLRAARDLFANGEFPIAAAPEGGTNDHSEMVSPLEPGIAQMGFWCMEDLVNAGRTEQVLIVPIGIQYRYWQAPWQRMTEVLSQLEQDAGLTVANLQAENLEENLYQRLLNLAEHLLTMMEEFYTRFYCQTLPELPPLSDQGAGLPLLNLGLEARLKRLMAIALGVSETYFGVKPNGSFVDRCRRLEQAAWDRIFRDELEQMSAVERGLADWLAEEASLFLGHMRLVERFTSVSGKYVLEKPTGDRLAEVVVILWKVTVWLKGGNPYETLKLGKRQAIMTIGDPLSVSDRWPTYQCDRRSAKQAVTDLTQDLQIALESLIIS